MFSPKMGIDLGTCNSLVFLPKKGIVLREPSVVAILTGSNRVIAVGKEAKQMIGKTPDSIKVYRPLREGVIADYRITQTIFKYFIKKVLRFWKFLKPEIVVGIPTGATSTERRALVEAGLSAGAKAIYPVKQSILSALGAGIPIESSFGNFIVDIGGGTTEIAVISLGGIVCAKSLKTAGDKMDEAISEYIKRKYNLAIGEQTAEEIKIRIGTALTEKEEKKIEIKGRDLISGLPKQIKISSNETSEALEDILNEIIQGVKQVLRETPPELSADIMERGVILAGGGSLLNNIAELFKKTIDIPAILAEDPLTCVARGTGVILDNIDSYKHSILTKRT